MSLGDVTLFLCSLLCVLLDEDVCDFNLRAPVPLAIDVGFGASFTPSPLPLLSFPPPPP